MKGRNRFGRLLAFILLQLHVVTHPRRRFMFKKLSKTIYPNVFSLLWLLCSNSKTRRMLLYAIFLPIWGPKCLCTQCIWQIWVQNVLYVMLWPFFDPKSFCIRWCWQIWVQNNVVSNVLDLLGSEDMILYVIFWAGMFSVHTLGCSNGIQKISKVLTSMVRSVFREADLGRLTVSGWTKRRSHEAWSSFCVVAERSHAVRCSFCNFWDDFWCPTLGPVRASETL